MLAGAGLPFALTTMALTPVVAFLLWRGIFRWYRVLSVAAVGSLVFAWGFAQSPYLLPRKLTIAPAIAPPASPAVLLGIAIAVVVLVLPPMGLLYYLHPP